MKNNRTFKYIFILVLLCFFVYFICCFPTYSQHKFMLWQDSADDIWIDIRNVVISNDLLLSFHKSLGHRIPEWTMPTAIIINAINMIFGFINYKKKWWYYLILIITVIMSIMLWDCFYILIHQDDMA